VRELEASNVQYQEQRLVCVLLVPGIALSVHVSRLVFHGSSLFQADSEARKVQELEQLHARVKQTFGKKDSLIEQLKEQLASKDLRIKVLTAAVGILSSCSLAVVIMLICVIVHG
jgi:hypothetical protein